MASYFLSLNVFHLFVIFAWLFIEPPSTLANEAFLMQLERLSQHREYLQRSVSCAGGLSFGSFYQSFGIQDNNISACILTEPREGPFIVFMDEKDVENGEFLLNLYVDYKYGAQLKSSMNYEVCFGVWRLDIPPSESAYWPPTMFGSWCNKKFESPISLKVWSEGLFRLAVQIRMIEPLVVFTDNDSFPMHVIDLQIVTKNTDTQQLPKPLNPPPPIPPVIDVIFGGFPKTGLIIT